MQISTATVIAIAKDNPGNRTDRNDPSLMSILLMDADLSYDAQMRWDSGEAIQALRSFGYTVRPFFDKELAWIEGGNDPREYPGESEGTAT